MLASLLLGDDVKEKKPNPSIYLTALKVIKIVPHSIIYVYSALVSN